MNAMILAAGFGTRLLPFTRRLPKPLFPLLDKTLLETAIETVKKVNPSRIVVNAHHLADMIEDFVRRRDFGVETIISREGEILGTAGGIKNAERWLGDDEFVVMNSDILMEPPWEAMISFHRDTGAVSTLLLRDNPDPARYSPVYVNAAGKVTRFINTAGAVHDTGLRPKMFTGASVLSPAIFGMIPAGRAVDISGEVYSPMTARGNGLWGYSADTDWLDVGTTADYYGVIMDMLQTRGAGIYIDPTAKIGDGARILGNTAIHADAVIGEGATLRDCVILPRTIVEPGAVIEGCVY